MLTPTWGPLAWDQWDRILARLPRPLDVDSATVDARRLFYGACRLPRPAGGECVSAPFEVPDLKSIAVRWGWLTRTGRPAEKRVRTLLRREDWRDATLDGHRPPEGTRRGRTGDATATRKGRADDAPTTRNRQTNAGKSPKVDATATRKGRDGDAAGTRQRRETGDRRVEETGQGQGQGHRQNPPPNPPPPGGGLDEVDPLVSVAHEWALQGIRDEQDAGQEHRQALGRVRQSCERPTGCEVAALRAWARQHSGEENLRRARLLDVLRTVGRMLRETPPEPDEHTLDPVLTVRPPVVSQALRDAWGRVLAQLSAGPVGPTDVDIWLRPCMLVRLDEGGAVLWAPDDARRQWLVDEGLLDALVGPLARLVGLDEVDVQVRVPEDGLHALDGGGRRPGGPAPLVQVHAGGGARGARECPTWDGQRAEGGA